MWSAKKKNKCKRHSQIGHCNFYVTCKWFSVNILFQRFLSCLYESVCVCAEFGQSIMNEKWIKKIGRMNMCYAVHLGEFYTPTPTRTYTCMFMHWCASSIVWWPHECNARVNFQIECCYCLPLIDANWFVYVDVWGCSSIKSFLIVPIMNVVVDILPGIGADGGRREETENIIFYWNKLKKTENNNIFSLIIYCFFWWLCLFRSVCAFRFTIFQQHEPLRQSRRDHASHVETFFSLFQLLKHTSESRYLLCCTRARVKCRKKFPCHENGKIFFNL